MKYRGYLICSDMDRTLKSSDGSISTENLEAIRMFQENGGRFTVVTGRNAAHIAEYADQFVPNAPICALNGAYIYDAQQQRVLYHGKLTMREETLRRILDLLTEFEGGLKWFRVISDMDLIDYYSLDEVWANRATVCNGRWSKVLTVWADPETTWTAEQKLIQSELNEVFAFARSWEVGLEFNALSDCKGAAALRLKEMLPDVQKVVCIGDYENDLSMIRDADLGVAVSNAIPEVLAVADRITVSNNESALAALIESLPPLSEE